MHKLLLSEPRIGSYSAFLLLGMLAGYLLARWRAARNGIRPAHIDNLALLISISSLFGARFFSWLFFFPPGVGLWAALTNGSGGMVFYGGLIFGLLAAVLYSKAASLPLANLLDALAPGVAAGLALGRIGCFMAGCCWGDICVSRGELVKLPPPASDWQVHTIPLVSGAGFPLAVRFPEESGAIEQHRALGLIGPQTERSLPVHPVQIYEAILAFGLCVFLHRRFRARRWEGQIVCWMIFGYAAIRFGMEFLRADNAPIYFGLTLSQVISVVLGAASAMAMFARSRRVRSARTAQTESQGPALSAPS